MSTKAILWGFALLILTMTSTLWAVEKDEAVIEERAQARLSVQPTELINLVQWTEAEGGNGHWYAVNPVRTHWQGARLVAESMTHDSLVGHLATITSAEENQFVVANVLAGTLQPMPYDVDQFYLAAAYNGVAWDWLTGEPFGYVNWGTDEPNNVGTENAIAMFGPNNTDPRRTFGTWNSVVLSDTTISPVHSAWSVVEFEPGFQPSNLINLVQWSIAEGGNDHWYAVYPLRTSWKNASVAARALTQDTLPGHLVTITSAAENQFIVDNVLTGTSQPMPFDIDQFYVGSVFNGAVWNWLSGEPFVYTNWGSGEPNNLGTEIALAIFGPNNNSPLRALGAWNSVVLSTATTSPVHNAWSIIEFEPSSPLVEPIRLAQWTKSTGGNGHWYGIYPVRTDFNSAMLTTKIMVHDSLRGHLATISSFAENQFIVNQILTGTSQPMPFGIDQFYVDAAHDGTSWVWLTEEPFIFTRWGTGEPNNPGLENAAAIFGPNNTDWRRVLGYWNSVVLSDLKTDPVHNAWSVVEFEPGLWECTGTTGDLNLSGNVDLSDLSMLVGYLVTGDFVLLSNGESNVNGTGAIDLSDLSMLITFLTVGGVALPNCP